MPTYEYECKTCGHGFEIFQSMKDDSLKVCPECGKEIRRVIRGGTGIIFKGKGFYVNDNGGKKSASTVSSSTAPSATSPACASCPKNEGSSKEKAVG
ncbi:MAG: FmdB family transcriptional regulator [Treponema sp. GWB1_62_6]|nr:MAG: FmdB family transcriptional regulator [Treponema sp. GWA1_62_8]OHE64926.1 MAG: FmdB family transcriptional regulator [Treponema sp. GWB1_62_6]OHE67002.1 MAG: FmdB family transcriptional regulator [Treponema sp. GWC1_61_84]OHE70914.1 MAG: FmdB family transcriptional regulator [Treponema sp. RIFOXYC1_FULL_61_9]HCM27375.1 FmdB family transcriptional regulator [Treponema sp.]